MLMTVRRGSWAFMDSPTENLGNKVAPGQDCQFLMAQLMEPAEKYWKVMESTLTATSHLWWYWLKPCRLIYANWYMWKYVPIFGNKGLFIKGSLRWLRNYWLYVSSYRVYTFNEHFSKCIKVLKSEVFMDPIFCGNRCENIWMYSQ